MFPSWVHISNLSIKDLILAWFLFPLIRLIIQINSWIIFLTVAFDKAEWFIKHAEQQEDQVSEIYDEADG